MLINNSFKRNEIYEIYENSNYVYQKRHAHSSSRLLQLTRRHPSSLINLERPYFVIIQSNLFASQKDDTSLLVSLVSLRETASCRNPSWWSRSCGWILRGRVKPRSSTVHQKIYGHALQIFRTVTTFLDIVNNVSGNRRLKPKRLLVTISLRDSSLVRMNRHCTKHGSPIR